MDHGSQPKSRLTSVTSARELLCLNRAGSMLNITSQRLDPEILIFCYKSILQKIGRMLKPLMLKFHSDPFARFTDIAEKQVPAKLNPIVANLHSTTEHLRFSALFQSISSRSEARLSLHY